MKSFTLCLFIGVLLIVAWSSISSGAPVHNGPPQERLDGADSNQLESLRTLEIQTEQKEDTGTKSWSDHKELREGVKGGSKTRVNPNQISASRRL
uniref:Putative secreted protein n=1 Tax=Ixodes ricinus TaxID=34613 RepID=V5IBW3_IXORI